jgi:hypothetical protein
VERLNIREGVSTRSTYCEIPDKSATPYQITAPKSILDTTRNRIMKQPGLLGLFGCIWRTLIGRLSWLLIQAGLSGALTLC